MPKFTPLSDADNQEIQGWIDQNPDHSHKLDASFYTAKRENSFSFGVSDDQGLVLITRLDLEPNSVIRFHVDFVPDSKVRIKAAITFAYPELVKMVQKWGFKELVSNTPNPALAGFMKRFGVATEWRDGEAVLSHRLSESLVGTT